MKKEMFEELKQSLREAVEISRGNIPPSRVFDVDPKEEIPKLRKKLGLSQSKFAAVLGISIDTLQNWEQGRRQPAGPAKVLLKRLSERAASSEESEINTPEKAISPLSQ